MRQSVESPGGERVQADAKLNSDCYRIDDLDVDPGQRRVFRGDQEIQLPKLSFSMLMALIKAAPNALSIDELTDQVWDGAVVSPATVSKRAELLRQALGEDSQNSRYVALVRGHGYRLIPTPAKTQRGAAHRTLQTLVATAAIAALVAGFVWFLMGDTEPPPARSIAVLPFANLGLEAESEYLSDGLATELTGLMTTIPDLKVAARTSAFAFKGRDIDVTEIARQLRVEHILSGSVQQSGDRMRITAQLVEGHDGYHIWSNSWDRGLTDIFDIQDEIAKAVIDSLQIQLLQDIPATQRADPEAYTYYLQGKRAFAEDSEPDAGETGGERHARALSLTTHALAIDPEYAPAWGQLAGIQFNQAQWMTSDQAAAFARAEASAHRALELDPYEVAALSTLGSVSDGWHWDAESAARWYKRALTAAPGDASTLNAISVLYERLGRTDTAHQYQLAAVDRDPLNSQRAINLALSHWRQGEFDAAREQLARARHIAPDAIRIQVFEALFASLEGNYEFVVRYSENSNRVLFACALHKMKRQEEALAVLQDLQSAYPPGATSIAILYGCLNDKDSAFAWLQRAYEDHDAALRWLRSNLAIENLQDDSRWDALLQKVGVSDAHAQRVTEILGNLGL